MRYLSFRLLTAFVAASFLVAGCSGGGANRSGGGLMPAAVPTADAPQSRGARVTLKVLTPQSGAFLALTKRAKSDHAKAYRRLGKRFKAAETLGSVVFSGYIYPSYAGANVVYSTVTVNSSSVPSSVTLEFNNVPAGNNEFVLVQVEGCDSPSGTGSCLALGDLGGLVNTGSAPAYGTITAASTLALQVAGSGILAGIVSLYDLENQTTLANDLPGVYSGTSPDPNTGLFSDAQLSTILTQLASIYNRTLVVSVNTQTPSEVSLVWDYRQQSEVNFVSNGYQLFSSQIGINPDDSPISVYGNPFFGSVAKVPLHTPYTSPTAAPDEVEAELYPTANGSVTFQHVYGGDLIVGAATVPSATSPTPPFYGALEGVAPRAPGNSTTSNLTISGTAQITMTVTDPQAAAFGSAGFSQQITATTGFNYGCIDDSSTLCNLPEVSVGTPSGSSFPVTIGTWNPWAVTSGLELCGSMNCVPESSGGSATFQEFFYDTGSNLSYFNWKPATAYSLAGSITGVATDPTEGYDISYSGGTNGFIATTTTTYFKPGQIVKILSNSPTGTAWYVDALCNGQTYTATGNSNNGDDAVLSMTSIPATVQCGAVLVGFSLPSGSATSGTVILYSINNYD
jgi:hypothetical protein